MVIFILGIIDNCIINYRYLFIHLINNTLEKKERKKVKK